MKLTKKQINKIKELKEKRSTAKEISIELKIPTSTVQYHYDENNKNRQIKYQQEYQKKNPPIRGDRYRNYQREYQRARYWKLKEEQDDTRRSR